jgi:hypothetical protein
MFKKVLVSLLVLVVNFSLLAHEGHKEAGLKPQILSWKLFKKEKRFSYL